MQLIHYILVLCALDAAPVEREELAMLAINDYIGCERMPTAPFDWAEVNVTVPTYSYRNDKPALLNTLANLRRQRAEAMQKHFDNITLNHCREVCGNNVMSPIFQYIERLKNTDQPHPDQGQLGYELRKLGELMEGCYREGSYFYDAVCNDVRIPDEEELDITLSSAGGNRDLFLIPVTVKA